MELWIRIQKNKNLKQGLVKVDDLIVDTDLAGKWCLYNDCDTLGIYKTEKRVLEIIDEIQNLLKPKAYIKSNMKLSQKNIKELADAYKEVFDDKVLIINDDIDIQSLGFITYEMPKE